MPRLIGENFMAKSCLDGEAKGVLVKAGCAAIAHQAQIFSGGGFFRGRRAPVETYFSKTASSPLGRGCFEKISLPPDPHSSAWL